MGGALIVLGINHQFYQFFSNKTHEKKIIEGPFTMPLLLVLIDYRAHNRTVASHLVLEGK